jgi:hypothetical protein
MYLASLQTKPSLINEIHGKAKFKTFKANNELFVRIDPVLSDGE